MPNPRLLTTLLGMPPAVIVSALGREQVGQHSCVAQALPLDPRLALWPSPQHYPAICATSSAVPICAL